MILDRRYSSPACRILMNENKTKRTGYKHKKLSVKNGTASVQYDLVKPNYFWFMYSCTLSLCTMASLKV